MLQYWRINKGGFLMHPLGAISPVDGRYHETTLPLSEFCSEYGLIRYRAFIEVFYLIFLSQYSGIGLRHMTEDEEEYLIRLGFGLFFEKDAEIVKAIETRGFDEIQRTNHDVKAVEYFLRLKLKETSLAEFLEWIHFGLTSEDVNNLAYGLMIRDVVRRVMLPALDKILEALGRLAAANQMLPMLARTHGQPASPTTLGKEFFVFYKRLERQIEMLQVFQLSVKFNGATGNFNAHHAAYPHIDWWRFTERFIARLNTWWRKNNRECLFFRINTDTTQIEPHDTYAELFHILMRINTILIDCAGDIWRYISDDWLTQRAEGVGSSTMPHKVNPIDFENCEGNLGIANALFGFFASKLPISRLQRDLSDSTVERNFGVAFAHSLIGYNALIRGLGKISPNRGKIRTALEEHPEVISEGIQTILRRAGYPMPYERLKELTQGCRVSLEDLRAFIRGLDVPQSVKDELLSLAPETYIGLATRFSYS